MTGKFIISGLILFLAFTSCANNQKENKVVADNQQQHSDMDSNTASSVVTLPSFSVQDVNGNVINLQSIKGKKLFVNFWATWCPPCKREIPSIQKLYKASDSNKVKFLLVSLDDRFELAKKYVSSNKINLPVFYPAENLPALFSVQGIPATFIFSESGELIKRVDGSENYDTKEYKALFQ